jgi:hypothetical protein
VGGSWNLDYGKKIANNQSGRDISRRMLVVEIFFERRVERETTIPNKSRGSVI